MKPWVGFDLDGTLAVFDPENYDIGPIVPAMKNLFLKRLGQGYEVRIFTARAPEEAQKIQIWLVDNGLPPVVITNVKDQYMVELYDDRAVQIEFNTGKMFGSSTLKYRRLQP